MLINAMAGRIWIAVALVLGLACQAYGAVNCTAPGRFAEPTDDTCQQYTLCVLDSTTGSYLAYNYTCPTTSVFNPNTAKCTTNYECNSNSTSTNTTSSSVCTTEGYIADPASTNCSSYIECVLVNSTYTETYYTCPNNTYFDPNTTNCDADYSCSSSSSNFTCSAAGRFANSADTTCQTYFLCVQLTSDGTYDQYEYTCPTTSVFSPTQKLCTTTYTCPS